MSQSSESQRKQGKGRNVRLLREPFSMTRYRRTPPLHDDDNETGPSKAGKGSSGRNGACKWLRKAVCCFKPSGFDEEGPRDMKYASTSSSEDTMTALIDDEDSATPATSATSKITTLTEPSLYSIVKVTRNDPDIRTTHTTPNIVNSGSTLRSWTSSTSSTLPTTATTSFAWKNKHAPIDIDRYDINVVSTLPAFMTTVQRSTQSVHGQHTSPKVVAPSTFKPPMSIDIKSWLETAPPATIPTSPVTPTSPKTIPLAETLSFPDLDPSPRKALLQKGPVTPIGPETSIAPTHVKTPTASNNPMGLRRIDVERDGNCLFRAISKTLAFFNDEKLPEVEEQSQAMRLRLLAWNSICFHRSAEFETLQIFEGGLGEYRKNGCVDGEYAGEGELFALADVLSAKIEVYIIHGAGQLRCISSYGDDFATRTRRGDGTIRLIYLNGNHYDALLPSA